MVTFTEEILNGKLHFLKNEEFAMLIFIFILFFLEFIEEIHLTRKKMILCNTDDTNS